MVSTHVRRVSALLASTATSAVLAVGGLTWAVPALAAPAAKAAPAAAAAPAVLPSQCSQSGVIETCTFTTKGETQFTVPENVSSITITAVGGHGGTSLSGTPGGLAAEAVGIISVTTGENLFLEVNISGGTPGRDNGIVDGGAGGGESDVRTCGGASCAAGDSIASRLLVAGGGGGGGSDDGQGHGGNAGTTGNASDGTSPTLGFANAAGGKGANNTGGGGGGASCGDGGSNGTAGAFAGGPGGNSNSTPGNSGGGGGAGFFGGGGGGGCARAVDFGGSGGGGTSGAESPVRNAAFTQATASQAASVSLAFVAPFQVTTASLPNGTVDSAYSQSVASANGTGAVTWQLDGGALPSGLSISSAGQITGTPTQDGFSTFTVEATDSANPAKTATAQLSITISASATAVATAVSPASPTFGGSITFTATVTDAAGKNVAEGGVQFVLDGTNLGSLVALKNGQAAISSATISGGSHTIEMDYHGTPNFLSSTNSAKFTVAKANTANFELSASPDFDATVATPVTLTATVTGLAGEATPTGTVTFNVDGNPASCNPATISGGQAQCALGDLSAGDHNFTAAYAGDKNYQGTTAGLFIYPVSKLTPSETVTAQPASPSAGQGVTFTATLTAGGSPVTTGTVQWLVDGTDSGSPVNVASDGTATLGPVTGLSVGKHTIEADYSGSNQETSTSAQTDVTIGQATPGVNLSASPASNATVATPVTLTATLTGAANVAAPTGSVTFTVDGQPANCNPVTISGDTATCALGDLPAGTHSFAALYNGDTNYGSATGNLSGYGVAKLTTAESITADPASPSFGQPVTFTATITTGGTPVTTGTVQWVVDGVDSGAPVNVASDGTATLGPIATLSVGKHTIEADYSGSDQDAATTAQTDVTVGQATPDVELSASPAANATVATPVTLTATLTGPANVTGPSGDVTFTVDGQAASCGTVTISGDTATCALGDLTAGQHDFGAAYGGDGNYKAANATDLTGYQVLKLTSSESIAAAPAAPMVGDPTTFTATITAGGNPVTGGSVQWLIDGTASGAPVPVAADGTATLGPITSLSVGQHTIEADYSGSDQDGAITAQLGITVGQATPAVELSADPASNATAITPVTLTATLVGVAGVADPTGDVTFTVDGQAAACGTVTISGTTATCTLGDLPAGTHDFGASYGGDTNYTTATGTLTGYEVTKLTTAETITPSVTSPVFGQPVSFTATVTTSGNPVTTGTVQWLVDGLDAGAPVNVGADGTAKFGPISSLAVGMHTIEADYSGSDQDAATTQQLAVVVGMAGTLTTINVTGSALLATVTPVTPGAGTPTGTVTFTAGGKTVGKVKLAANGTAKLAFKSAGAEKASAGYSGDASFSPSSASTATKNPKITAKLTSAHAKTKFGWYRSPVKITFTCTAGSAPLTAKCPAPVTLSRSAAAQMVSRTIHAQDGGIATVVVSPVNIDQIAPQVKVTGAKNGATVDAPGAPKLSCVATDKLSGLAGGCVLAVTQTESTLTWTAIATDKAGNTTTSTGSEHLIDYFVAGATRTAGSFVVTIGKFYTVEAFIESANTAPKYVFAAPAGTTPHPVGPAMTKIGPHLWAIRIHITKAMSKHQHWTLGVKSGGTLHTIPITLQS